MHFEANYYKGYEGYKGTIMPTPTPTPHTPTPLPWGVTPTPAIHYRPGVSNKHSIFLLLTCCSRLVLWSIHFSSG